MRIAVLGIGPDLAFILLIAGMLGIYAEFCAPGLVFPAVLGGIFVTLGVVTLPMHWTAAVLVVVGLLMVALEAKFAARGLLGFAGVAAMIFGATGMGVHLVTALSTCVPFSLITIFLASAAIRARANKTEAR